MRTEDPRINPPPRTLFISSIPVSSRIPSRVSMEERGMASPFPSERPRRAGAAAGATSEKLFHVPQDGHRPSHLGSWWPQRVHSKSVFGRISGG